MTCRRKTKTERELVADIRKTFEKYCSTIDDCKLDKCPYYDTNVDCMYLYVKDLVKKARIQEREEMENENR